MIGSKLDDETVERLKAELVAKYRDPNRRPTLMEVRPAAPAVPDFDSEEFNDVMAEAWEDAQRYAMVTPWGSRMSGRSEKARAYNLSREIEETRMKFVVHRACELILGAQPEENAQ